jgi:uncharacterized protein
VSSEIGFLGGLLMGLAGSPHCIGLCGGISSALLHASPGSNTFGGRTKALATIQLGRVTSYVILGALVGGASAVFSNLLQLAGLQFLLRLVAAGVFLWSGLALIGVGSGPARLERLLAAIMGKRLLFLSHPLRRALPFLGGMCWGFAPCGMVYGALLNSMLTGSWLGGATFMSGFAMATIPPVSLAAFGMNTFAGFWHANNAAKGLRRGAGIAIVTMGLLSVIEPAYQIASLCG